MCTAGNAWQAEINASSSSHVCARASQPQCNSLETRQKTWSPQLLASLHFKPAPGVSALEEPSRGVLLRCRVSGKRQHAHVCVQHTHPKTQHTLDTLTKTVEPSHMSLNVQTHDSRALSVTNTNAQPWWCRCMPCQSSSGLVSSDGGDHSLTAAAAAAGANCMLHIVPWLQCVPVISNPVHPPVNHLITAIPGSVADTAGGQWWQWWQRWQRQQTPAELCNLPRD